MTDDQTTMQTAPRHSLDERLQALGATDLDMIRGETLSAGFDNSFDNSSPSRHGFDNAFDNSFDNGFSGQTSPTA
jgi:hypothetical protein